MQSGVTSRFKKQIPKNAIMAFLSFLAYALSAIWLTPYLVGYLGPAAYGLVPLAAMFTQYVSILTSEISTSVNRFLTIEIQRGGGDPNRVFNSSLFLYLILIAIQVPLFSLAIIHADRLFSIPPDLRLDALLLFGFSAASFLLSLLGAVFGISIFSANRLDVGSALAIVSLLLRLVSIIALFGFFGPKLRYIGYVDFCLQVMSLLVSVYYWRVLTPELSISFKAVDVKLLNPVFRMSFWGLINRTGSLLYEKSDIWIINRFISPIVAGQYAAILVVSNFVRQLSVQIGAQFAPTIMDCWAKDDLVNLKRLLAFTIKMLAFGLTIPAALLCLRGGAILHTWLGPEFAPLAPLLILCVVHLPVNMAINPFFTLNKASNRVRVPAIVSFCLGVFNLAASYYLGVELALGAWGVALVTALVLTAKNALFTPIYGARILGLPALSFLKPIFASVSVYALAYAISLVPLARWLGSARHEIVGLLLEGALISFVCGLVFWFVVVSKSEKATLLSMLPGRARRLVG